MFRDAKIGDRVWSMEYGWGRVAEKRNDSYPIRVCFDRAEGREGYTNDGRRFLACLCPSLFWSEVEIVSPPKPKRKIKKVIEGWVGLYREHHSDPDILAGTTYLHATKDGAERGIGNLRAHYGDSIFIRHEYEVEE